MYNCEKCIHEELCDQPGRQLWGHLTKETDCSDFKDRQNYVEVVHGHWCWEGRFKACSKCGSYVEFTETLGASHWKYCPYCGAKMDGERRTDG